MPSQETLTFPSSEAALLAPYLPPHPHSHSLFPSPTPTTTTSSSSSVPPSDRHHSSLESEEKGKRKIHVTLTYAHSLDASLALAPGVRTALSGARSKAMTHFLRARHDAILVGAGTAVADDPGLNSRLADGAGRPAAAAAVGLDRQPRPVVLDPRGRWEVGRESRAIATAREGRGKAPWVLVDEGRAGRDVVRERSKVLGEVGGRVIALEAKGPQGRFDWADVLAALEGEGLRSVMIEGGGEVINSLLAPPANRLVDSVIVTIAPTWLGQGGVVASPPRTEGEDGKPAPPVRLTDVRWCPLGEDVVLCGRILR